MKNKSIISAVLLTAVIAGGGLLYFTHAAPLEKAAAAPVPPAVPVVAGVVAQHDVPIYLSGVGTVIAYNTDVVRAQIQGQIISINFMRETCSRRSIRAPIRPSSISTPETCNAIRHNSPTPRLISRVTPHWVIRVGLLHNCLRPRRRK